MKYGIYRFLITLQLLISLNAYGATCKALLGRQTTIEVSNLDLKGLEQYEVSRLVALSGDFQKSIEINQVIRDKISTMSIVAKHSGTYGSHGAYKAELEDGTEVLIKPHSEDWYASIPKEVGVSILADIIGLPIVPVAGYRLDEDLNTPVSVHLIQKVDKVSQAWSGFRGFINFIRRKEYQNFDSYGPEIRFLMRMTGYSFFEASPRHVLNQKIGEHSIKSLIDLGSAFIDQNAGIYLDEVKDFMLGEGTMQRIETLDEEYFKQKLAPYFPEIAINALYLKLKQSVHVMRVAQRGDSQEMEKERESRREFLHIPQKWQWREALTPPQIAHDFNI